MEERDASRCSSGDLSLEILSRVSDVRQILRLSCVCKAWRQTIRSQSFARLWHANSKAREVWSLLRVRPQSPQEPRLEMLRIPSWSTITWCLADSTGFSSDKLLGLVSSHGLVCGALGDRGEDPSSRISTMVVGNPVTNSWKVLPPITIPLAWESYHMETDINSGNYTITIFFFHECFEHSKEDGDKGGHGDESDDDDDDDDGLFVLQYESTRGSWSRPLEFRSNRRAVASVRELRGSMITVEALWSSEELLAAYDPATMSWTCISFPFRFGPLSDDDMDEQWGGSRYSLAAAFRYEDHACIVAGGVDDREPRPLGLAVWRALEQDSYRSEETAATKWKLVSRISFKELYGDSWETDELDIKWKIQLLGDMLVFSSWYKRWTHGLCAPALYNLVESTWSSHFVEDPSDRFPRSSDYECCAFVPGLIAP